MRAAPAPFHPPRAAHPFWPGTRVHAQVRATTPRVTACAYAVGPRGQGSAAARSSSAPVLRVSHHAQLNASPGRAQPWPAERLQSAPDQFWFGPPRPADSTFGIDVSTVTFGRPRGSDGACATSPRTPQRLRVAGSPETNTSAARSCGSGNYRSYVLEDMSSVPRDLGSAMRASLTPRASHSMPSFAKETCSAVVPPPSGAVSTPFWGAAQHDMVRPRSAPSRRLPQNRVSQAFLVNMPNAAQPVAHWPGNLPPHQRGHLPLTPFEVPGKPAPRRLFQSESMPNLESHESSSGATSRCLSFGTGPGWSFALAKDGKAIRDLGPPSSQRFETRAQPHRFSAPKLLKEPNAASVSTESTSSLPVRLTSDELGSGHLVRSPPGQDQDTGILPIVKVACADGPAAPGSAPTASPRTPDPAWSAPTREVSASDLPKWCWPEVESSPLADMGPEPASFTPTDQAPADQAGQPQALSSLQ